MADEQDASEKTEEPSQKKLDDAHGKGDVAKSQEIPALFVLFAATLLVMMAAPWAAREIARPLAVILAGAHDIPMDGEHLRVVVLRLGAAVAAVVAVPVLAIAIAAVAGNMVQHRLVWSAEQLKPKFSKVSPLAGFKRLFSADSLVNFVKGLVKIAAVSVAIGMVLWPERDRLDLLIVSEPSAVLAVLSGFVLKLLGAVLAVMIVVAALDYGWQRHKWHQRQRMSVKELKEEFKQQEGSPEIKGKVKQLRAERARRRMMQNVPKATVVVANPTHFAVALSYASGMAAPKCVAKGVDAVALRIRALAAENGVPVVEDPPLARLLHAAVDLDEEIPPEHYKAVAKLIGYVMNLKRAGGWRAGA